jgi:FkbM family methyltransferase
VYAFEPLAHNLERLRANLLMYHTRQVMAVQACLAARDGTAEFYISSGQPAGSVRDALDWDYGNKSSSLLRPKETRVLHPWLRFDGVMTVPTTTLKAQMEDLGIDHVDFLHLDVQGAELMVLRGASDALSTVATIWLEVEAVELYAGQPLAAQVEAFLARAGYVRILDTVESLAGDQFWARAEWVRQRKGHVWVMRHRLVSSRTYREARRRVRQIRARARNMAGGLASSRSRWTRGGTT